MVDNNKYLTDASVRYWLHICYIFRQLHAPGYRPGVFSVQTTAQLHGNHCRQDENRSNHYFSHKTDYGVRCICYNHILNTFALDTMVGESKITK